MKILIMTFSMMAVMSNASFGEDKSRLEKECAAVLYRSCLDLGNAYFREGDTLKAYLYFDKACEIGPGNIAHLNEGCFSLGFFYPDRVPSVMRNMSYTRACSDGDAMACNTLGRMYYEGEGCTKNIFTAVSLYRKACKFGIAVGCVNLGTMYRNGEGVKQNDNAALALYGRACDMKEQLGCKAYSMQKHQMSR